MTDITQDHIEMLVANQEGFVEILTNQQAAIILLKNMLINLVEMLDTGPVDNVYAPPLYWAQAQELLTELHKLDIPQ